MANIINFNGNKGPIGNNVIYDCFVIFFQIYYDEVKVYNKVSPVTLDQLIKLRSIAYLCCYSFVLFFAFFHVNAEFCRKL